jgi:hypothetical protein
MSFDRAMQKFETALARQLATTKKSHESIVRRAFKGVMRRVFTFTPPMSSKSPTFIAGRQAGQAAIKKDMARMFRVIPKEREIWLLGAKGRQALINFYGPDAVDSKLRAGTAYFLALHRSHQGSNKHIKGRPRVPIFSSTFNAVYKELLKWQGWVPSGWNKGAAEADVRLPGWINGKNAPGSMVKTITDAKTAFKVINDTKHEDANNIQYNINYAIVQQANAINREFEFYLKKLKLS